MYVARALGLGFILWLTLFLVVSVFSYFNLYGHFLIRILLALLTALFAYLYADTLKPDSAGTALLYGILMTLVVLALDNVVLTRFNPDWFESEFVWVGYLMVVLSPIFHIDKKRKRPDVSSMTVD